MNSLYIFAQAYGSGTYDSSAYSTSSSTTSTGSTSGSNTSVPGTRGGTLTNTGFDILLASSLACAIIFAALLIRFWKRPVPEKAEN